jgi:uncharacterized membrane protein YedE/YeeE
MDASSLLSAAIGGALIGLSASALLWLNGRIAGISGIAAGLVTPRPGEVGWRLAFVLGLLAGGLLLLALRPDAFSPSPTSLGVLGAAGLLVGIGTRVANGCTSGHGVCGLARRAPRSLAATAAFMGSGALTVFIVRHVLPRVAP